MKNFKILLVLLIVAFSVSCANTDPNDPIDPFLLAAGERGGYATLLSYSFYKEGDVHKFSTTGIGSGNVTSYTFDSSASADKAIYKNDGVPSGMAKAYIGVLLEENATKVRTLGIDEADMESYKDPNHSGWTTTGLPAVALVDDLYADATFLRTLETKFLDKVKGKTATGKMGPMNITYTWNTDGKSMDMVIPKGTQGGGGSSTSTTITYTFKSMGKTSCVATYTDSSGEEATIELASGMTATKGTLTAGMGSLPFDFPVTTPPTTNPHS